MRERKREGEREEEREWGEKRRILRKKVYILGKLKHSEIDQ